MKIVIGALALLILLIPAALVVLWLSQAQDRHAAIQNEQGASPTQQVAVAAAADEQYCTPDLKRILRRVLQSCGLIGASGRGCAPVEARNVAQMSGEDFNALFVPMQQRGAIVQFDRDSAELDPQDTQMVDQVYADRRGASYYFVVSRASPEGNPEHNLELSKRRAEAVLTHMKSTFNDPDLEKEVGLLSLGEEFAQLNQTFCQWRRSAQGECTAQELNRSAFVAWIDCRL